MKTGLNSDILLELFDVTPEQHVRLADAFKNAVTREAYKMLKERQSASVVRTDGNAHALEVLRLVSQVLNVRIEDIKGASKKREFAEARFIYGYLLMELSAAKITFQRAGEIINKDHSTIVRNLKEAKILSSANKPFDAKLQKCIAKFKEQYPVTSEFMSFDNIPQL